ncbi:MAG: hypothetical protein RTU92_09805 [Candidatus Thorarchaeota archaeon]
MSSDELMDWLCKIAGPSIRFRVLVDILNEQDVGVVSSALDDMIQSVPVHEWIERLKPNFEFNEIHSGNPEAYENVMGKLVMLGLRAGLQPFDNKTLPFRVWLTENTPSTAPHSIFYQTIIASFLSYAGYGSTSPVANSLKGRLDALFTFARSTDFSTIYVDKSEYKGLPKSPSSQEHELVNPELYPDQQFVLPWIHDIRGIAFCNDFMENAPLRAKAETVVKMVLSEEYQEIPFSYGLAKYGERYYVIGWAVQLPGYRTLPEKQELAELILNLEMMARFDVARKSEWFKQSLEYLESFQTEHRTYQFPRSGLPEKNVGYWVGGLHMGLEENRKSKLATELESTFWVLWIKHLAGLL